MDWKEALPLLQENHTGVAISVTPQGRAQSTIVSTAVLDGKLGFASRPHTVKLKNIQRTGRATVTVIKLDTRRYVTVEGPAAIEPWQDKPSHIKRLKDLYVAMGRAPKGTDEAFAEQMRDEERSLVLVTPERVYGSLRSGA
ncbi:MAG TPA: pyridoxamine 5'-phosphate oxidase family protein [Acidobacteriota bacterium]|nr:pyridoxamine 5'-phosphate oxidase family protein [Acidobacteriota bacterium]